MKRIAWSNDLSVGIGEIDEQHQQWIAHYNDFVDAMELQIGVTVKTLDFLIDYTDSHIRSEEQFMTTAMYPGLEVHAAQHAYLRQTLANLVADFDEEGQTPGLEQGVETFLGNWLVTHIRDTDRLFGQYVKEHGIDLS